MAVDPPERVRRRLAEWARGVAAQARESHAPAADLRLLDVDSMHLTLCFLGSRPVGEIEALAEAVRACEHRACELAMGAPLWLPPRRPRTLAVEIHDRGEELARTRQRLVQALCLASSWEPERRRFRPHITVARMRGGGGGGGARSGRGAGARGTEQQSLAATPQLAFEPEAIVLYRSWLAREGATYEPLASGRLAPAPS